MTEAGSARDLRAAGTAGGAPRQDARNGSERLADRSVGPAVPMPPTDRGRRTREELIDAARGVFEERGYLRTRISDIAGRAGVAHGSFYNYFDSKEAVFLAVMDRVNTSLFESAVVVSDATEPVARIEQSMRQYLRAWTQNAAIMGVIQEVAMINPDVHRHRQVTIDEFRSRIERGISRMQRSGRADDAISPRYGAQCFSIMISNFCYEWLVHGGAYEEDEVVRTFTTIWTRSIGLTDAVHDGEPRSGP